MKFFLCLNICSEYNSVYMNMQFIGKDNGKFAIYFQ